ncbi:MAG: molecular chaperone TorD family protein [Desulfurivibrionaceae bacterium]
MTTDQRTQASLTISDAYRLLAACFYEPEKEMFLEENLCANLAALMDKLALPASAASCRWMGEGLQRNSQEELLQEYAALFLGPFNIPAHPYGSVYLEEGRRLMGDSTMEVKKVYAEAGVKHEGEEFPDHIAIELEFMSFLEQKIAQAISEANQADLDDFTTIRNRFFTRLLAPWAPQLGKAIVGHASLPFYFGLGECLNEFIASEKQRLAATEPLPAP